MGNTRKPRFGWIEEGIGYIPLTKGQVAKVDPEDLEVLEQKRWYASFAQSTGCFYAARAEMDPVTKKILMYTLHREIMGLGRGGEINVDHINHDTLDNRKCNLRLATRSQNHWNTQIPKVNTSGYKGVTYVKKNGRYQASLNLGGKTIWLGYYGTPEEAYSAYCDAAKEKYGEFACL